MPGIYISEEEMEALMGIPALAQRLYVFAIRKSMTFETGMVGVATPISWHGLARELRVESAPGIKEDLPGKQQVRRAAQHLVKQGLIIERSEGLRLMFECPLARLSTSVQKKADTKPTHLPDTDADIAETEKHSVKQQVEVTSYDEPDIEADIFKSDKPTHVRGSEITTTSSHAQGAQHDGRSFAMTWDWYPSEGVIRHCRAMRVNWAGLTPQQRDALIDELRSYWVTQPTRLHTQDQWDRKLAQQVVKKRWGGSANETSQPVTHGPGKPLSAVDRVRQANRDRYEPYPGGQIIDVN